MDTTGFEARERADHLSRQAAADAHAAYYAHPSLHFPEGHRIVDEDRIAPQGVGALNAPIHEIQQLQRAEAGAPTTNEVAEQTGSNEGRKEEAGGKENAAPPTQVDKGAFELGGEAGGTHSSPGPSAALVKVAIQAEQGKLQGVTLQGGADLPDDKRKGATPHWSVAEAMNPHLQMMCGPLLSYYTVQNGIWHGAVMVVTADNGSDLDPLPTLSLKFFPYISPASGAAPSQQEVIPEQRITAQQIHTYQDQEGPCSFWRFLIEIPVQPFEVSARYRLNGGAEIRFVVPAAGQNLRWAAHSCNGFSTGVNPDEFKSPGYTSGYDPVWEDLLKHHHQEAYHCMVGGGDQIYCDALTREPALQSWITAPTREKKINHPLTDEMKVAIDRFYFHHYCKIFRSNAFGRANSTVPMVNMLDDHDLIDGFGTYDDETQASPVFSHIGSRGYFWFLLFQLFSADDFDGIDHPFGSMPIKSMLIGSKKGPWIPFWSHHLSVYLGPQVHLIAVDCRAERSLETIIYKDTYEKIFTLIANLPPTVEHLVVLLGVPIAYPRMSFLEHFLDLKWNPLNILARRNALGLGGMVNKFNQASELLDDLNDHWCANTHKKERNWLVLQMQRIAMQSHLRITFLSGDVHLAAVGCLFTHKENLEPALDHRYMLNVVTSAIVNTPPPAGAAKMVGFLSGNKHRTLHKMKTDEKMLEVFKVDTDGTKLKKPYVLPRRNYASISRLPDGDLAFEIRVEKKQGYGDTVPYLVKTPAPKFGTGAPGGMASVNGGGNAVA